MDKHLISLSKTELLRIQKRINKLKGSEKISIEQLERRADDCWAYPNADEKYEQCWDAIGRAEEKISLCESIIESIGIVLNEFEKLEQLNS